MLRMPLLLRCVPPSFPSPQPTPRRRRPQAANVAVAAVIILINAAVLVLYIAVLLFSVRRVLVRTVSRSSHSALSWLRVALSGRIDKGAVPVVPAGGPEGPPAGDSGPAGLQDSAGPLGPGGPPLAAKRVVLGRPSDTSFVVDDSRPVSQNSDVAATVRIIIAPQ